jgi:hypothetical protein
VVAAVEAPSVHIAAARGRSFKPSRAGWLLPQESMGAWAQQRACLPGWVLATTLWHPSAQPALFVSDKQRPAHKF